MTQAELQTLIDTLRNETVDGANTKTRVADILDGLKSNNIPLSGTTEENPVTNPVKMATGLTYTDNDLVPKEYVDAQRPYKVYTANIKGNNTNQPIIKVRENTFNSVLVSRQSTGCLLITSSEFQGADPDYFKAVSFISQNTGTPGWVGITKRYPGPSIIEITNIITASPPAFSDSYNFDIEIRVYN